VWYFTSAQHNRSQFESEIVCDGRAAVNQSWQESISHGQRVDALLQTGHCAAGRKPNTPALKSLQRRSLHGDLPGSTGDSVRHVPYSGTMHCTECPSFRLASLLVECWCEVDFQRGGSCWILEGKTLDSEEGEMSKYHPALDEVSPPTGSSLGA
jgi:hypothetical protein